MSCQQVPRLTEDPYTFTDTAPATATLFNPQIHKLTPIPTISIPIHQSDTKNKCLPQKAQQQILSPNQRIFTNQANQQQQLLIKHQQQQRQLLTTPHLNGTTTNIQNGIQPKNDGQRGGTGTLVNQRCYHYYDQQQQPTTKLKTNNLNVTTQSQMIIPQISTTPTRKFVSIPFPPLQPQQPQPQQQHPQQQQLPQIVSLDQSNPLFSIAKQSPIITSTTNQSTVLPPLYQRGINSMVTSNSQKYQLTTVIASNSPGNSFNVQPQQNHNHSSFTNNLNNVKFEPLQTNSLLTFPNLTNVNQLVNQISPQNITANAVIATNQPLPVSNFAQPQQIKQLSSTVSPTAAAAPAATSAVPSPVLNNKCNIRKITASPKASYKEPKPKKRKESESLIASDSEKLTGKNKKSVFVAPAAAKLRDSRVLSTGSVGNKSKANNKSQVSSAARTRRAYSQSSHHEALQRISTITKSEWHAPESYVFDCLGPFINADGIGKKNGTSNSSNYSYSEHSTKCDIDLQPSCVQKHWLQVEDIRNSIPAWTQGREKRIELRKAQLRRQAMQYVFARKFMSQSSARKRLVYVSKALKKLKNVGDNSTSTLKKCSLTTCQNTAVALTTYCYLHITRNTDQHLFLPCTAKFADNTQCRIPVFDISHELPLCREHAWKRDNYQRTEPKPKNVGTKTKKKTKAAATKVSNRVSKRPKKKRRPLLASDSGLGGMENLNGDDSLGSVGGGISSNVSVPIENIFAPVKKEPPPASPEFLEQNINSLNYQINRGPFQMMQNDFDHLIPPMSTVPHVNFPPNNMITATAPNIIRMSGNYDGGVTALTTQEMLSICENSSAYESSEDTGVGGLSESELMNGANDVIEEIPLVDTRLLEEHDLTNVLNQLPVDAFNELFTAGEQNGAHEPTVEEQEDLERALELINKQVKSLQQMTSGDQLQLETNFLESFLDDDECQMLDDSDICADDVLHSPDTSGIDTSNLLVDGTSNSGGSCSNPATTMNSTSTNDLRNLVHIQ